MAERTQKQKSKNIQPQQTRNPSSLFNGTDNQSSQAVEQQPKLTGKLISPEQVLQLQRLIGNRATRQWIASHHSNGNIQRETKRTEKGVLDEVGTGGLTTKQSQKLIDKMDKDQDFKHARKIAEEIETESETLVSALPKDQQQAVREALKNYVSSSTAIQTNARGDPNALNQNVLNLDAALQAIRQQITTSGGSNERIVYRSISYDSGDDIPYGQTANGQQIDVGDYVGDKGFLSTSEHRQFILGKEQTGTVQGLLKLAIYSKSGVPIAIHIPTISYTNVNQKSLYDMNESKKNQFTQVWNSVFGPGAMAGQAEVLFPRNAVFEVKKIQRDGNKMSVVLEEFMGTRPSTVKNMKFGSPL